MLYVPQTLLSLLTHSRYAPRTPSSSPPPRSPLSSSPSPFKPKRERNSTRSSLPASSSSELDEQLSIPRIKLIPDPHMIKLPVSHSSDNDTSDTLSIDNFPPTPPSPCSPPLGKMISTIITHVSSPGNFYICTSSPEKLQQLLDTSSQVATSSFTITGHMFCCAKFFSDNQYHRALVLGPAAEEATWEVLFIDYGNTEMVSSADLVPITDQLATLPMIAFQCKLHQVEPAEGTTWTEEACSCFRNLVLNKAMHITLEVQNLKYCSLAILFVITGSP